MGPYSHSVFEDIETLRSISIMKAKPLNYVLPDDRNHTEYSYDDKEKKIKYSSYEYSLDTGKGMTIASELWKNLSKKEQLKMQEFKSTFNSLNLRELLLFVYSNFPKYTEKSEIRGNLGM